MEPSFVANYLGNLLPVLRGGQPDRPLMFSYYVTHRCELNCVYCCDGGGKRFREDPFPELSTAEARNLISILRHAGDTLDVTGGEPLLRDDLAAILSHAKKEGFLTVLNTKGIGIDCRPDVLKKTDVLVLSLDSLDPGRLSEMLGAGRATAQKVLGALEHALSRRRKLGFRLVLSSVATPGNLGDVEAVLDFCLRNRIGFQISPEIIGTRVNPALRGDAAYRRLVARVRSEKARGGPVLGVQGYLAGIARFRPFKCMPLLMPVIRPDGNLYYPCLESKNAQVGILGAGGYRKALDEARRRVPFPSSCGDCCHIFCHMALSLLQSRPLAAFREMSLWRKLDA